MKIPPLLFDRSVTGETANAGTVLSLGLDQAGSFPERFIILPSCSHLLPFLSLEFCEWGL
jgi:hypothetical protein